MPKPKPGKKSIPWQDDPEILKRLATVEDLALAGYRNTEIGHALNVTEGTIRRDRERIAILWRDQTSADILGMRIRSIANLRRVQRLADNEFRNERDRPANLRLQLDAEREIIKLQGTITPVETPITFPGEGNALDALTTADLVKKAAAMEALAKKLLGADEEGETAEAEALGG